MSFRSSALAMLDTHSALVHVHVHSSTLTLTPPPPFPSRLPRPHGPVQEGELRSPAVPGGASGGGQPLRGQRVVPLPLQLLPTQQKVSSSSSALKWPGRTGKCY